MIVISGIICMIWVLTMIMMILIKRKKVWVLIIFMIWGWIIIRERMWEWLINDFEDVILIGLECIWECMKINLCLFKDVVIKINFGLITSQFEVIVHYYLL
jgi:hypothetical protein